MSLLSWVSLLMAVPAALSWVYEVPSYHWDYIILGAGPAGLQMGYFLQQAQRDYVILERNNISGSFFQTYPRHDKMISINKRHTGKLNKEFNLRHDWNSLLSHDESLLIRHYTRDFFPHREVMIKYLNDYTKKLGLNVWYDRDMRDIKRLWNETMDTQQFEMMDQHGHHYSCRWLIVATGLGEPNIPNYKGMEHIVGYETVSTDPMDFEGKNVLILGHGNAAFETADAIYGHASVVHVAGRSRLRLAWETHYVGDLRGINNNLLDTYQLKSLDGVVEGHFKDISFVKDGDRLRLQMPMEVSDNFAMRDAYDVIVRCMGFKFNGSIFHESSKPLAGVGEKQEKFPWITPDYQVVNIPGMFVVGLASHSIDFRKSAGGFIHGFRYTARSLHHLLEWQNHHIPWPNVRIPATALLNSLVKRMNEASGIYQMFGVLVDVITINWSQGEQQFHYIEEFPASLLPRFSNVTGQAADSFIVLVMQYGLNYSGPGKDVFRVNRATGLAYDAHRSNFLHPVLYYYRSLPTEEDMDSKPEGWPLPQPTRLHHIVEDFLTQWMGPNTHILPLRRFLEYCTDTDLRNFYAHDCLHIALTGQTLPLSCASHYLQGQGLPSTASVLLHDAWLSSSIS